MKPGGMSQSKAGVPKQEIALIAMTLPFLHLHLLDQGRIGHTNMYIFWWIAEQIHRLPGRGRACAQVNVNGAQTFGSRLFARNFLKIMARSVIFQNKSRAPASEILPRQEFRWLFAANRIGVMHLSERNASQNSPLAVQS